MAIRRQVVTLSVEYNDELHAHPSHWHWESVIETGGDELGEIRVVGYQEPVVLIAK